MFVTIWISTTKIQKISEITKFLDAISYPELRYATFSIMLLMLVLTLIVSLVLSMVIHAKVSVSHFFEGYVENINKIVLYLFLFMVYYSLLSLLDVVMNIFNFGQFAFVVNDIKNREKQQKGLPKEIKYPWFLSLWLYILKAIGK